jgi:hypothetical protein
MSTPNAPCRALTDDDLHDAQSMMGWKLWFGPILFTIGYPVAAWFFLPLGWEGEIACFLTLGGLAIYAWVRSLGSFRKFASDKNTRLVNILEGAPDRVYMTGLGGCYVCMSGLKIRVGNDYFSELRDANNVRIEFLPTSLLAVRVQVVRGIGA